MVKGLKNKVVLVTGAAQGIGRGIALRLAQEGAHIALVDMKQDRLNDVQQEIQALDVNRSEER
ncbi:MAG TPA: diacetyl reductase, partial [Acinetobacter nosocomialis]|nr:diacetyl reductase [Acinetobacter nosocomialis]